MRRIVLVVLLLPVPALAAPPGDADLDRRFGEVVKPFLASYCVECHSGAKPKAQVDLAPYDSLAAVVQDHPRWAVVLEKLAAKEMPPEKAKQPTAEARQAVIAWIEAVRRAEADRHAGDPGVVLARRLSNSEYNYTIRDLTGVDLRPAREFPVDPANPAGFDNSGESLSMSPSLMKKYLDAAREVANHLVFRPSGLAFAPHPMLVDTDRDRYCVNQIVDFYHRQDTDYADYFQAAWRFRNRAALGKPRATLATIALESPSKLSPKYLTTIWHTLAESKEPVGPLAKLQAMWRKLPAPRGRQPDAARQGCEQMRDFVVALRKKIEPRFEGISAAGLSGTSQPFLMWKNRQYASHRMSYDPAALQVDGEVKAVMAKADAPAKDRDELATDAGSAGELARRSSVAGGVGNPSGVPEAIDGEEAPARPPRRDGPDADLRVPSADRARYEAAFARFAAVFPDNFYVSERGRNYLDKSKDRGRLLSAGFHNLMGYFRDDQPLYQLVLDEKGQKELDALWQDLDFVAEATSRTFVQFYLNGSGEARERAKGAAPADHEITAEGTIRKLEKSYLAKTKDPIAVKAIEEHFDSVNTTIRWVEKARMESEPKHLETLMQLATRAYRRALTDADRSDLLGYYRSLRDKGGLSHEDALRDTLVSVLMSPDFCYRIDLVSGEAGVHPLSDDALASRLSYFLWSSMPDDELLAHARAGDLHRPEVLAAQTRRMLADDRVRGLATEFAGNWLDFRRFEEHNAVDRERFKTFDNELRQAMFEEPIRFTLDVIQSNRSVLDFLYGKHTFVNRSLARHYGMPDPGAGWARVDDAGRYGRGGLLPMAVFLTKNAPGLRTSPVKRGYWVVKSVLGERIPPPPAVVPELPRDEAKLDLPLRQLLARHREDPACSGCHARFDALGLVFEAYGPIGERRTVDLAGHPVDAQAQFPGGATGTGLDGLRAYIRQHRQDDFVDNLTRKLLAYGLGRSLTLSDEGTVRDLRTRLTRGGYHFETLVEGVVASPQFRNKRGRETVAER
jgi:hypothetical protein